MYKQILTIGISLFLWVGCRIEKENFLLKEKKEKNKIKFKILYSDTTCCEVREFLYNGHVFICYTNYSGVSMLHAPYCKCKGEK